MDAHPIKSLVRWLDEEARSIPLAEGTMEPPRTNISELKARIAAGEYSLDADAIAEAMFGRADRAGADSEVLEPGERGCAPRGVDKL